MQFSRALLVAVTLALAAQLTRAQDGASTTVASPQATLPGSAAGPAPGHSAHGEAFNEGPRQAAYLMQGMPRIEFPVTTKSAEAQRFFNQGVGQLHGFWYFEAERSFRQAAALDPDCAMAYWGMAAANVNNHARAKGFIAKAVEKKGLASHRESLWIEALAEYQNADPAQNKDLRRQYVRRLEAIIHEYPDDIEARAFLVAQIWSNNSADLPITSHQAVDSLIGEILAAQTLHPAHHYRIHLWDYEKAARGRASAAQCGQSSPGIAHMWHMPGHIFSDLRRYQDAAWQQEASARVDHAYLLRDRVMPYQIHNYGHNNEWFVQDLCHVGRIRDAVAISRNLIEIPQHPKHNALTDGTPAHFGRARLLGTLGRFELWDELLALTDTAYLPPTTLSAEQIRRLRAIGTAHYGKGDRAAGAATLTQLETLLSKEKAEQEAAGAKAEAQARQESKTPEEITKARDDALAALAGSVQPFEAAVAELAGHEALAAGQFAAALEKFAKASDMEDRFLSLVHLRAGDHAKAEELARKAVTSNPEQVLPLANLVYVLAATGKKDEAATCMEQLRRLASQADLDLPAFARLAPFVRGLNLPADWRYEHVWGTDSGVRPALDSLGPLCWTSPVAGTFTLPDSTGQPVSVVQQGKPVVILFYLGFGCLQCVEQLKAFGPTTGAFRDLGVDVVAISNESCAAISQALAARAEGPFPFPILSDEGLGTFKAYRAYDDFEQRPLHATIFVDGEGRIRWQEISFEPFADANFLLEESRRLLELTRD